MSRKRGKRRKHPAKVPHLLRQRGKARNWTGWLEGREVGLGTADPVEANRRLDVMAAECKRAPTNDPPEAEATLASVVAQYIEYVQPPRRSPRTAEAIENRLLVFVEWAEAARISHCNEVSCRLVAQYIRHRATDGVSARTINRDVTPIAQMLAFAKRMQLISLNPLVGEAYHELRLREPVSAPNHRTLTSAQVDEFIQRTYKELHVAYAALFDVLAGSGVRLDEACNIDMENVDDQRKLLSITPKPGWSTKNHRFRDVPVSVRTIEAVRTFIRTKKDVSLDRKAIWNQVQRVRKLVGLDHFSPHDLRRSWASALHARGASIKSVSLLLGHGSIAVTERYIRAVQVEGHQYLPR
jgi:site-specific recombinase XerD